MSKKLAMVAVSGLVLGAVCMASAAIVAGPELAKFDWNNWDGRACNVALAGKRGSRAMDWTAGDEVDINLPANVRYKRGQGEQVVVEGDEALLKLVQINGGDIEMDCRMRGRRERLTITLPGREFRAYSLHGSGDITLEDIDQPRLDISIAGSGKVTASGRTDELKYYVAGSGDGRFADLQANVVNIDIAGSGDVEVSPRDKLSVDIAGSGKVTLRSEPAIIDTNIAGSGRIIHVDGSVSRSSGLSRSRGGDH